MSEWQSMSEHLPEVGQAVLVTSEAWENPKVLQYNDFPHQRLIDWDRGWHCWYPERMHWMPLPPPPSL